MNNSGVTRVLWRTRHKYNKQMVETLEEVFGPIELVWYPDRFAGAYTVAQDMKDLNCDELVLVAPEEVFIELTDLEISPLYIVMRECDPEEADSLRWEDQPVKFVEFVRIVNASVLKTPLVRTSRCDCLWLSDILPIPQEVLKLKQLFGRNVEITQPFGDEETVPADYAVIAGMISEGYDTVIVKLPARMIKWLMDRFPDVWFVSQIVRYPNDGEEPNYVSRRRAKLIVSGYERILSVTWVQESL